MESQKDFIPVDMVSAASSLLLNKSLSIVLQITGTALGVT